MAPKQVVSSDMEFHQPSITKPSPLRIIKRSQTISGHSAPREVIRRHSRGISESSYESRGSPPAGPDRPLTIHKLRGKDRGSVLSGLGDGSLRQQPDTAIQELVQRHRASSNDNDPDVTPKAKQQFARTVSAGEFCKPAYYRVKTDNNESTRPARGSSVYDNPIYPLNRIDDRKEPSETPKIPIRRLSKSKNFFLKAIGGRSAVEPELKNRSSASSRGTLRRRLSRHDRRISSSSNAESMASISLSYDSFGSEGQDIADVRTNQRISNQGAQTFFMESSSADISPSTDALVLCPYLTIISEVSSADSGGCSLWVAVSVTGVLREPHRNGRQLGVSEIKAFQNTLDLCTYGSLYALRFDFRPGPGCVVEEILGDLYKPRTIRAASTELILVKIRLSEVKIRSRHVKESSDELMAELQNHLGEIMTPYLTARITYRHSAFPDSEHSVPSFDEKGPRAEYQTQLQTEARAVIKRTNLQSAWSPRTSRTTNLPLHVSPLIQLIETHLTDKQAREAIRRLASERVQIPPAKRNADVQHGQEPSSEETVRASGIAATIESAVNMLMAQSQNDRPTTPASLRMLEVIDSAAEAEMDPARKIWSHMRHISRPSREKHDGLSDCHSDSSDEEYEADYSSAPQSAMSENGRTPIEETDISDQYPIDEGSQIQEFAVQRHSVGADIFRSLSPSRKGPAQSTGPGAGAGTLGLALGGKSWGWVPPWW